MIVVEPVSLRAKALSGHILFTFGLYVTLLYCVGGTRVVPGSSGSVT